VNLDDQIRRYFGASNLEAVPSQALNAGIERMLVDLALTKDRGERFALWALLHTLGSAPDLDVAFKSDAEREAAEFHGPDPRNKWRVAALADALRLTSAIDLFLPLASRPIAPITASVSLPLPGARCVHFQLPKPLHG
jgi:hypothetical protein